MTCLKRYWLIASLFIFTFGCSPGLYGTKVNITNFAPDLSWDHKFYSGKKVYLMNFENGANDTSLWYYYSPDKKFTYSNGDTLVNYFWYAFQKSMHDMGMQVSNVDRPNPSAPAMWLSLKSATEDRFQIQVNLQGYGDPFFVKIYTVSSEPLTAEERAPEVLEKRAYEITNRFIETVLTDPEFRDAFAKAELQLAK